MTDDKNRNPTYPSSDRSEKHQKHLELAGVVKGVHAKLRRKYRESGDFTKIWDEHCQDQEVLCSYANAMHHLAVDHWTERPETRIHWCRAICHEFFLQGGLTKAIAKDERTKRHKRCSESSHQDDISHSYEKSDADSHIESAVSPDISNCTQSPGDMPEDLVLPSSLPDRFSSFPAQRLAPGLTLNITRPTQNQNIQENSPALQQSPVNLHLTPDSERQNLCPPESTQQNPLDKCKDFMITMDLPSPSSQEDSADQQYSETDIALEKEAIYAKYGPVEYNSITLPFHGRIRLLDVGSCFNPFLDFEEFLAVGIDISPAVESVFHCDFLHLETPEPLQLAGDTIDTILSTLSSPITRLPRDSFHVVVFSLLLEYFPCPYQRWLCCQKAHALLMMNGLLLIITPDSGHQNKNASMMKSWKRALEGMGFKRWKYVKQEHLHCMAYRKMAMETEHTLIGDTSPDMFYIPQDYSECPLVNGGTSMFTGLMRTDEEMDFIRDSFSELPDMID